MHQKSTLSNGLRLVTTCTPHTRSVSIIFFVGAGARYETEPQAGISHFVEHICFKGTEKRRSPKEISEAIEGVGGIINGGTDKELTTFWCKVATQHFSLAVDVLVDLLRNPRFDAKDIDRERQVIVEEINMSFDSPQQRVNTLIDTLLWPGQPLGRDVAGKKETVTALPQREMVDFFSNHYLPNNTVISVAGDIEQDSAEDIVKQALSDWRPKQISPAFPSNNNQEAASLHVEFRDTKQVHLCLGIPGPGLLHHDRFAIDLLSIVLGEGMSSRLFTELREQRGLVYDIHSYAEHFTGSGAVIIHAGLDPGQVTNALPAILDQLSQLKENISEAELNKAKQLAKGRLLLALENSRNVASWAGTQEMLTNRIRTADEVISVVEHITAGELERAAQQVLTKEKLNLAIVGPVYEKQSLAQVLRL